jgi:predicted ABC-type ATPase
VESASGKSSLIKSELQPNHRGAVVIDPDQLWLRIPEYGQLAAQDWKTAGERTYAEVRYLRDVALAEAAEQRLDVILETFGDERSEEAVNILEQDGYEVSANCVDCPPEVAQERIRQRG